MSAHDPCSLEKPLASQPDNERATRSQSPGYRRDIDGLRAVAILPVVLFHAGVGAFAGGFVGVDVFFVISGYLITSVIAREIAAGRFSMARFYVRRAKRILPALITVTLVTLGCGFLLLGPSELRGLGKSVAATALSVSNVLFLKQAMDYFAGPADLQPLLMTWSLGVEEQFYLLWPLALVFAYRRGIPPRALLGVLALLSFAASWWGVLHHARAAYYLLPTRGWELAIGAALGLGAPQRHDDLARPWLRDACSVTGLLLVCVAVGSFGRDTPFPGPAALLPCVGTALLLWAGEGALVNRLLLARTPLVFAGLISYSLYLWHWPILALLRIRHHDQLTGAHTAGAMVVAAGLAYLSWRFVERPFRQADAQRPRTVLLRYTALTVAVAALGALVWASKGFPQRVPAASALVDAARNDVGPFTDKCDRPGTLPNPECITGPAGEKQLVALWGDSHAATLAPLIQAWAASQGLGFALMQSPGCPALSGVRQYAGGGELRSCAAYQSMALKAATSDPRIGVVVLSSRWSRYAETSSSEGGEARYLTDDLSSERTQANSRRVFADALSRVSGAVTGAGKELVIIGPVPEIGRNVIDCMVRRVLPLGTADDCSVAARVVKERQRFVTETIVRLGRSRPAVRVFLPAAAMCPGAKCMTSFEGRPLYLDDSHLSRTGALFLAGPLSESLASQGTRPR